MTKETEAPYLSHLFQLSGSRVKPEKQRELTWFVTVHETDGSYTAHAGQFGGKITTKRTVCKPKNVGRANETTAVEQARIEAKADWLKKVQRKLYKQNLDDGTPPLFLQCMLALDAAKYPHRIRWDSRKYFTQPKLNGVRFIAQKISEDNVTLTSREGMSYAVKHIQEALNEVMTVGMPPLDGELYLGEDYELGDVTGALKPTKKRKGGTVDNPLHIKLEAHLFDMVHDKATGLLRYRALEKFFHDKLSGYESIKLVPIQFCSSAADLEKQHDIKAASGYEGIMLRDSHGLYDYGEKNEFLYKFKKFQDQEFLIVGVTPDKDGTGGLFTMATDNSDHCDKHSKFDGDVTEPEFTCRSKGTNEQRAHILANPHEYIGKLLTIRFSEKLKTGVPEFNRGITKEGMIAVRDYE